MLLHNSVTDGLTASETQSDANSVPFLAMLSDGENILLMVWVFRKCFISLAKNNTIKHVIVENIEK